MICAFIAGMMLGAAMGIMTTALVTANRREEECDGEDTGERAD